MNRKGFKKLHHTLHFDERAQQRCLAADVRDFILTHGSEVRGRGACAITVRHKDIPGELRSSGLAKRAADWVVVIEREGKMLLTCYRRHRAFRFLKREFSGAPDGAPRFGTLPARAELTAIV